MEPNSSHLGVSQTLTRTHTENETAAEEMAQGQVMVMSQGQGPQTSSERFICTPTLFFKQIIHFSLLRGLLSVPWTGTGHPSIVPCPLGKPDLEEDKGGLLGSETCLT